MDTDTAPAQLPAGMYRCRITASNGASGTSDLNPAAIAMYRAKAGWEVAILGKSLVIIVED